MVMVMVMDTMVMVMVQPMVSRLPMSLPTRLVGCCKHACLMAMAAPMMTMVALAYTSPMTSTIAAPTIAAAGYGGYGGLGFGGQQAAEGGVLEHIHRHHHGHHGVH